MRKIAVIGQGYVGLPLALAFSEYYDVVGYDVNVQRVQDLNAGIDKTLETDVEKLKKLLACGKDNSLPNGYIASSSEADLKDATIFIITVPTPIDQYNSPDLSYLISASKIVGRILKRKDIVIYESTVYPGCTEEDCVPVLEEVSEMKLNIDFFVGYSPERINPGDKVRTLENVIKITSGSTPEVASKIDILYQKIIKAGTYKAESIKVAEAAKVIENAQRDVNISFVNELSLIFDKMGLDTTEVLNAAATKYNFLKFSPGLVGGHCISVDPYYLTHKASTLGYVPEVILSGRRVNNKMGLFVASKTIKLMLQKDIKLKDSNILVLGFTFKENCPDIRNTSIINIYKELVEFGTHPTICDPWVEKQIVNQTYGIEIKDIEEISETKFDAIIIAVAHSCFEKIDLQKITKPVNVIFDCKGIYPKEKVDARL